MTKKIVSTIIVISLLGVTALAISYLQWRSEKMTELKGGAQVIDTAAGQIEYVFKGDKGPVVLFLHGTPGGYDQAAAEDPDFRLLAPSRPGYLGTPLSVGKTPAEQASAYAALLDALQIDSVIVTGASGGGPSALSFAAMYPERTLALIAIEALSMSEETPGMPWFMSYDFLVWMVFSLVDFQSDETAINMMIPGTENRRLVLESADKTKTIRSLMWSLWPPSRRETGTNNDFSQFANLSLPIGKISAPTLIIHGSEDINVPIEHSKNIANSIQGAEFHIVEGGDHMMPFTHAEEVEEVLGHFMRKIVAQQTRN
jgi:pimeloyl-ACP methyl ester carboxylesterase